MPHLINATVVHNDLSESGARLLPVSLQHMSTQVVVCDGHLSTPVVVCDGHMSHLINVSHVLRDARGRVGLSNTKDT